MEDRLDNIYRVVDAIRFVVKKYNSGDLIARFDVIHQIDKLKRFSPGSIRSGVDHWLQEALRKGIIERDIPGVYKLK